MSSLEDTSSSFVPAAPPAPDAADPAATDLPSLHHAEIATARRYADASRAASTQRAYASDWRRFSAWCLARGLETLPADPRAVAVFLSAEAEAGSAPFTVGRRLAAIGWMHRRAGLQPPQAREGAAAIREVMAGIRRSHGIAPVRKHAADADVLRDVLRAIAGDDLRSVRDRALLAFGMAGAFRRSELVALRFADLERVPEGLRVTIRRSKTDQDGAGATIAIPEGRRLRPKALLNAWLERGGISDGFLFRRLVPGPVGGATASPMSDRAVARLVQLRVAQAGYVAADFAGHSLRAGFLTAAARSGASVFKMREVSRHKSGYVSTRANEHSRCARTSGSIDQAAPRMASTVTARRRKRSLRWAAETCWLRRARGRRKLRSSSWLRQNRAADLGHLKPRMGRYLPFRPR